MTDKEAAQHHNIEPAYDKDEPVYDEKAVAVRMDKPITHQYSVIYRNDHKKI